MENFDAVAVGMRGAAFIGALQATGVSLFLTAHRHALGESAAPLLSLARPLLVAAVALVIGHQALEAARLAGDWAGVLAFDTQWLNWHRSSGRSALLCAGGLALQYAGWVLQGLPSRTLVYLGAMGVFVSFPLTGHTSDAGVPPLVPALLLLHVAIAGYWLGSVVALLRLTRAAQCEALYRVSTVFSASAVWLVPVMLPLGAGVVYGLVPNLIALRSMYGALLAVKVGGFALLLLVAAGNRGRLVPALRRAPVPATRRFRQALQAEYLLLSTVVMVTSVMTSLYSWH